MQKYQLEQIHGADLADMGNTNQSMSRKASPQVAKSGMDKGSIKGGLSLRSGKRVAVTRQKNQKVLHQIKGEYTLNGTNNWFATEAQNEASAEAYGVLLKHDIPPEDMMVLYGEENVSRPKVIVRFDIPRQGYYVFAFQGAGLPVSLLRRDSTELWGWEIVQEWSEIEPKSILFC